MKLTSLVRAGIAPALAMLLFVGGRAQAGIVYAPGNNPQPNDENVLLNNGQTGSTIFGTGNNTGLSVAFSSTTDTLTAPSGGQARVEPTTGLLNNVTISVPGGYFTSLVANPFFGSGTAALSVYYYDATGGGFSTANFNHALSNGSNYFTIYATGNDKILSITVNSTDGFQDLRQNRIGGATIGAVPEPASLVMGCVAIGLVGMAGVRRRRAA